jgi:hypothetical protein
LLLAVTEACAANPDPGGEIMKRIAQFLSLLLTFSSTVIPAQGFSPPFCFDRNVSEALEAARLNLNAPRVYSAAYAISKFADPAIVDSFSLAWRRAGNGTLSSEGVVLILKMKDGKFSGREMGATNEYKRFTFGWHPATIAIVHTHPNSSDARPQDDDLAVANKYHVPIFTITSRGMFVYDPGTKKISRVMLGLDWLDESKWVGQQALGKL